MKNHRLCRWVTFCVPLWGDPKKSDTKALWATRRAQGMACGGDVFTIRQDDGYPAFMLYRVHLFLAGLALSALTVSLVPLPVPAVEKGKAVQAPAVKAAAGNSKGGQAWSFGASRDRNNALWYDGVETESLHKRALGRDRGNSASIEHALREADRHAKAESRKAKEAEREAEEKSRLGMNIRRDDSVWRAELPSSEARPDELRPLERRHVVRAYADFMDSDDASLTIGPELMLKDEHNEWGKKSRPEENDPSLGLGMQFSLDF